MIIESFIKEIVFNAIENCNYDPTTVSNGICSYAQRHGFHELKTKFTDSVIKRVIVNSLTPIMSMKPDAITLYFSHYSLIERLSLLNNQSLIIANAKRAGKYVNDDEILKIEEAFDDCMKTVCQEQGLRELLDIQISEIILNIDYAKGVSSHMGQRLNSLEGDSH